MRKTQVIYIDILICLNLFVNYFILLATAKYIKQQPRKLRMALGALFGAVSALIILLPDIPFIINFFIKLIIALLIVIITFGYKNIRHLLKSTGAFFLISFCYCGAMIALWFVFTPKGMIIKNETVYFNISPLIMIISTLVCYAALRIISRLSGREAPKKLICKIKIINLDNSIELYGKVDTGNSLIEPFTGAPVIVVDELALKNVLPTLIKEMATTASNNKVDFKEASNFRLIPFSSVGGAGTLPAFKPQLLYIDDTLCNKQVYIAVCKSGVLNGEYKAMVSDKCLKEW